MGDYVGVFDGSATARIIELMPEKPTSGVRLGPLARKRLAWIAEHMDITQPQALALAVTHLRGTMARDMPMQVTVPDEDANPPKAHKRGTRAA